MSLGFFYWLAKTRSTYSRNLVLASRRASQCFLCGLSVALCTSRYKLLYALIATALKCAGNCASCSIIHLLSCGWWCLGSVIYDPPSTPATPLSPHLHPTLRTQTHLRLALLSDTLVGPPASGFWCDRGALSHTQTLAQPE